MINLQSVTSTGPAFCFVFFIAAMLLTGCAVQTTAPVWSVDQKKWLSPEAMMSPLLKADYVILGERHDNAEHHRQQLNILQDLHRAGWLKVIALEMLTPSQQIAMNQALQEKITDLDLLKEKLNWSNGWDWNMYGPILVWAVTEQIPVRAANLDRSEIMVIYRDESHTRKSFLNEREQAVIRKQLVDSHCGRIDDGRLAAMTRIQLSRDARMASVAAERESGAALLVGAYHARNDIGVPRYIRAQRPDARIISIGFVEVEDLERPLIDQQSLYDMVWPTLPVVRENFCSKQPS